MMGVRFQPSARIVPVDARPERRRGLAAREVVDEEAALDERVLAGRHALVVPAEGAVAALARRVGHEGHERRAVPELAEHAGLQERAAREGDLAAERAIELGRVAARLVDLERHLARLEEHACACPRGRGAR